MGCWGYGILESDDALDVQYNLEQVAGLRGWDESSNAAVARPKLEAALPALLIEAEAAASMTGQPDYDRAVGFQVLAATLMAAGCAFDETVRTKLLEGILYCGEYVEAKAIVGNPTAEATTERGMLERYRGRIAALEGLVEQMRGYDLAGGKPVRVHSRGLFQALDEHLAAGEEGLLNKKER